MRGSNSSPDTGVGAHETGSNIGMNHTKYCSKSGRPSCCSEEVMAGVEPEARPALRIVLNHNFLHSISCLLSPGFFVLRPRRLFHKRRMGNADKGTWGETVETLSDAPAVF